jgi:predicted DNA-binding protein with PD1-like motif/glutaredoxin
MHAVPLHLAPGSDLRSSLEDFARAREASGFVLGVVGDLSRAAFQCPGQAGPTVIEGDLEIITLNGTLSPRGVHLHLSLSDGACQVWGGHLEPGTVVRKGAELLVGLFTTPSAPTPEAPPEAATPAAAAAAGGPREVEIAVLSGCPFSARAQRLLRTLGIPHQVLVVRSAEERAAVEQRSGHSSLPQVFIDGQPIGGYDALAELHGQGALEPLRAG